MNISCDVIRDILPLYAENMASPATRELVDAHLCGCDDCTAFLGKLIKQPEVAPETDTQSLNAIRKIIRKRRILTALLCFFLTAVAALGAFAFLTRPIYLTLEEAEVKLIEEVDTVYYEFGDQVDCFSVYYEPGDGKTEIVLTAYRRLWNVHYGNMNDYRFNREVSNFRWGVSKSNDLCILYGNSELGQEDTVIWGHRQDHSISLPRLVLNYYVAIAALLLVIFALATLFLRKRKAAKVTAALAMLSASYILSSYIVMGKSLIVHVTSDLPWFFGMILCCTVLLWLAMLCAWALNTMRRNDCGV